MGARDKHPQACVACDGDPLVNLALSVFGELSIVSVVNLGLASMAAHAASKGGTSMHGVLIRIASHWLATCSVIASFDFKTIQGFQWAQQAAEMEFLEECAAAGNSSSCS